MRGGSYLQIKSPPVVLETVDEETIIVNLDTGSYYDLNHSGGCALHALDTGKDIEAAVAAVAERYGADPDLVGDAIGRLVDELIAEGIVVEAEGPGPPVLAPLDPDAQTRPYEDPKLGKYTDMQELLLLDPVHEVDEAGWPNKA